MGAFIRVRLNAEDLLGCSSIVSDIIIIVAISFAAGWRAGGFPSCGPANRVAETHQLCQSGIS